MLSLFAIRAWRRLDWHWEARRCLLCLDLSVSLSTIKVGNLTLVYNTIKHGNLMIVFSIVHHQQCQHQSGICHHDK